MQVTGYNPVSPAYAQASTGDGSTPPKKYIKIDGVTQLNPAYTAWKNGQGEEATSVKDANLALPVVTNMDDAMELNQVSKDAGYGAVPLAATTDMTIQILQDEDVCRQVGMSSDELVDGLGAVFAKYEAPMGLMNKLMGLTEYHEMEFLVDDSGSMSCPSDTKDPQGRIQTRWAEARERLKQMMEVLAYVPTPRMRIRFLNNQSELVLQHQGERPQDWLVDAQAKIDRHFNFMPNGLTPFGERIQESLNRGQGQRIARYFFGDGEPNGRVGIAQIYQMVINRKDPEGNPITFLSCTGDDEQVEWMKELEELAPYAAEYDDFHDERDEVLRDQGLALPFTRGFHLIGQLVAAMNPEDLDAMDESVPFTKWTLDNLLGVQTSNQEFRHYFDQFKVAQTKRQIDDDMDRVKKNFNWEVDYNRFLTETSSKNFDSVKRFKAELAKASKH